MSEVWDAYWLAQLEVIRLDLKFFLRSFFVDFEQPTHYSSSTGATGFDGTCEAVAACRGLWILVKPSERFTTANTNLALAA